MERLNASLTGKTDRPIKVVQFGEGNFLRAFVDYMIDIANEKGLFDGNIVLIKPISFGSTEMFKEQDCKYTVSLRGIVEGEAKVLNRQVTSVEDIVDSINEYDKYMALAEIDTLRFVVSNTTEAGIVFDNTDEFALTPAKSFPGKLTQFLYRRYTTFNGAADKGLVMLPVELIDDNGIMLKKCVNQLIDLWGLEEGFKAWVNEACIFTSTLVDRIVTGYPRDTINEEWEKLGYEDRILVTGEPFALWVIESEKDISGELPLDKAMADMPGMNVIFTDNQKPYKQRKVRILNGAHTSFVLASFLCGQDIVLESMNDPDIRKFIKATIYDEVIPTLTLPKDELEAFAAAVETRFENPYVKHALLAISLNSVSKWRARCMPSLLGYVENTGKLPAHLTFSLAALMAFYTGTEIRDGKLVGHRGEEEYMISDDAPVLEFFAANCTKATDEFVAAFLSNESFFGQDLTAVAGLKDAVAAYLDDIKANGMRAALCKTL
ncbi:MAG: tagaturonate reductase [Lachnospiraceae bacterium]|nr:tagaturonate reductase [Lachnospiraceae bacterium]